MKSRFFAYFISFLFCSPSLFAEPKILEEVHIVSRGSSFYLRSAQQGQWTIKEVREGSKLYSLHSICFSRGIKKKENVDLLDFIYIGSERNKKRNITEVHFKTTWKRNDSESGTIKSVIYLEQAPRCLNFFNSTITQRRESGSFHPSCAYMN